MMMAQNWSKMMGSSVAALFALLFLAGCGIHTPKEYTLPRLSEEVRADHEIKCSNYSFELDTIRPSGENDFRVLCDGVKVYSSMNDFADDFSFIKVDRKGAQDTAEARSLANPVGPKDIHNDIDNDGIPEIFLVSDSDSRSGARHTILLLGPLFRQLEYRDYDETLFIDVDLNGSLEIVTRDYGVTGGIGEPDGWPTVMVPPVVELSVRGGRFAFPQTVSKKFDPRRFQLMMKNGSKMIEAGQDIPDEVGNYMLELIYQGEGEKAFDYLDRATSDVDEDTKLMYENWITLSLINSATFFEPILELNHWEYVQPEGEASCPEGADRHRFIKADGPR